MTITLASLGWEPSLAAHPLLALPGYQPGRITRADRGISTVLTEAGEIRASLGGPALTAAAADPVALPCAGDWVALRTWPDHRVTIEAVLPRRNAVVRRTAGKDATGQVLAANLNTAAVVASLDPTPELETIERLLALAWESGAQPYLILTKSDLVADPAAVAEHLADIAPGVPVLAVSVVPGARMTAVSVVPGEPAVGVVSGERAVSVVPGEPAVGVVPGEPAVGVVPGERAVGVVPGESAVGAVRGDGIAVLRSLAGFGRTLGLIGASGAGKSTLVNALAGGEVMGTQAIRRVDGKGRHTTTYRALIPIPGGGAVLDTPGLRSAGLLDGEAGLDQAFADVRDLAQRCRFADCRHEGEPGCAIARALATGELSHRRWASWLKLLRELNFERRRVRGRGSAGRIGGWRATRRHR